MNPDGRLPLAKCPHGGWHRIDDCVESLLYVLAAWVVSEGFQNSKLLEGHPTPWPAMHLTA